jgi:hydroxymethylglutaryl-CoA synthase
LLFAPGKLIGEMSGLVGEINQLEAGFIVPTIGNTYSACSPLGLSFVLEKAKKDEKILLVSYGSGSGSHHST